MREFKFRAWDKQSKKMFQVRGLGYNSKLQIDEICIWRSTFCWEDPEYFEVMQYTGLKDKNGKEIYEGDKITVDTNPDMIWHGTVKWTQLDLTWGLFLTINSELPEMLLVDEGSVHYEVIGNIYEYPELMQ